MYYNFAHNGKNITSTIISNHPTIRKPECIYVCLAPPKFEPPQRSRSSPSLPHPATLTGDHPRVSRGADVYSVRASQLSCGPGGDCEDGAAGLGGVSHRAVARGVDDVDRIDVTTEKL